MSDVIQRDPLPGNRGYTANIKYDTLMSYTPNRKRDTWQSLGSLTVDFNNKVFNRNSVFRLVNTTINTCPLSGYFFFVMDEDIQLTTSFSWSNMQLVVNNLGVADGSIIDSVSGIIHPNIYVVMSPTDYSAIVIPFDSSFIPYNELQGVGVDPNSNVVIDESELNILLGELGVPFIKIEELEYSREQILNLMVLPAMKEYFKWYPISTRAVYPCAQVFFSIPIPYYAIGVVSAYVNPNYMNTGSPNNPFGYYAELYGGGATGGNAMPTAGGRRRRGFPDTQAMSTIILERAVRASTVNYAKRQRVAVHIQQGVVTGYANVLGNLEITWASFSNQWKDIPFNRLTEVRKLCTAKILRAFGMLRSQANSELPGTIKYEGFVQRADTLEKEIMDLWYASTKASVVRV
jgi:hypothetical protein